MTDAGVPFAAPPMASGRDVSEPSRTVERWEPRFYVRYVAWHNLVDAWGIEDRLNRGSAVARLWHRGEGGRGRAPLSSGA